MRVIVVGAGVMGAASAWALSTRGHEVTLLEQFRLGHARGSSHGHARIFRFGYAQDDYVALARAAFDGWQRLGGDVLTLTGAVDHGDPAEVEPIATALERAGVASESLTAGEAERRWPGFRFDGDVLFHTDGGRVDAEAAVTAFAQSAVAGGTDLLERAAVSSVVDRGDSVAVTTPGRTLEADLAVVAAGAWSPRLAPPGLPPITPTLEHPVNCRPLRDDGWPSFVHYRRDGSVIYGLAEPGAGIKFGEHGTGAEFDPDSPAREPDPATVKRLVDYAREWLPGVEAESAVATPCIYDNTPTHDPVIDRAGRVIVATGFSGHGFKFAPAVGNLVADLADGHPGLQRFRLYRD